MTRKNQRQLINQQDLFNPTNTLSPRGAIDYDIDSSTPAELDKLGTQWNSPPGVELIVLI